MLCTSDIKQAEKTEIRGIQCVLALAESVQRHRPVAANDPVVTGRLRRILAAHTGEVRRRALQRLHAWPTAGRVWGRLAPAGVTATRVCPVAWHSRHGP